LFSSSLLILYVGKKNTKNIDYTTSFRIIYSTPEDRHYGREQYILANRRTVYEKAQSRNPKRWSKEIRNWDRVELVWLNPAKKDQPSPVHHLKKAA
jgi:hypothetical protein